MNEKDLTDDYIGGLLRDHFKAEVAEQPASRNPWDWLKSRLESPSRPPGFRGFLSAIPKPLVAGIAVLVVLAGVTMLVPVAQPMGHLDFREEAADVPQSGPDLPGYPDPSAAPTPDVAQFGVSKAPGLPGNPGLPGPQGPPGAPGLPGSPSVPVRQNIPSSGIATELADSVGQTASPEALMFMSPPDKTLASRGAMFLQAPPPSATNFKDYERSWLASTAEDNVSTFSLDTDRTSFQLALNWARSGHTVDPDSVRAEEWINAFDYGYDPPVHQDSFAITTDVFRHPLNSRMHMVRVGFQAPQLQDDTPLNVTLVLDASGSMSDGNRVAIAREAAESIRRSLGSRDRIGVVQFTTDVIHDLTVEHTAPDDRAVRRSIDRLVPHASTNVQAGLDLGVKLADRARRERPDAYNYIILMSDGVANVNATDPFAILESAYDEDTSNPLRLITIGVGIENYNDYLLEQLAQHGNGWYRYLSDVDQARATFSRENWLALSIPFADQTRAQVTWNDEVVEYWRMIGYENRVTSDESFVEDRKEFAEIPMGAATTVFFEVQLHDDVLRRASNTVELGDVQLRWVTPKSGLTNRQSAAMTSQLDRELGTSGDALLEFAAIVALASDRYGSLPYVDVNGSSDVRRDLQTLSDRLQSLSHQLGHLDSYRDFAFLLDHMMAALPSDIRSNTGYSR